MMMELPRSKAFFILCLLFFSINVTDGSSHIAYGEEGWTTMASMPTARWSHACAVVNGKIYAIGGWNGNPLNTVEEYNPVTNTWKTRANMPTARRELACNVVNGKIYAIGGLSTDYSTAVEEYDPATDTWTRKADMPTGRRELACAAVNGKIYAIGGRYSVSGYSDAVEEYDPATNTWATKTSMPTARKSLACGVSNGRIYAVGGYFQDDFEHYLNVVEEYDPAQDRWSAKTNMPTARRELTCASVNGKIYVIGGYDLSLGYVSTVEKYYPATDQWATKADMPTARNRLSCGVVDGSIYAIGGDHDDGYLGTVERYTVSALLLLRSTSHPDMDYWYNRTDFTVDWTPGDFSGANGWLWVKDDIQLTDVTINNGNFEEHSTTSLNFLDQSHGGHFFHFVPVDNLGFPMSDQQDDFEFHVNRKFPLISSSTHPDPNQGYAATNVSLSWINPDVSPGSMIRHYTAFNDISDYIPSTTDESTSTLSRNYLGQPFGTHYFHIVSEDNCGNLSPAAHFKVTILAPTSTPTPTHTPTPLEFLLNISQHAPASGDICHPGANDVSVMAFDIEAEGATANITDVSVTSSGSGDEMADVSAVCLWRDMDSSRSVDAGDLLLQGDLAYGSEDGSILFTKRKWTVKESMGTSRYQHASCAVGGKVYVFGGCTAPNETGETTSVEEYDPATDTWLPKAPMPSACRAPAAGTLNGKIYVMGGRHDGVSLSTVYEFDPVGNTWTIRSPMPTARDWFAVTVADGRIYAIGGYSTQTGSHLTTVEEYDPLTDTWASKKTMPTARRSLSAAAYDGKIYAFGGSTPQGGSLDIVEEYDAATDAWTTKSPMPNGRRNMAAVNIRGRIYLIGGTETELTVDVYGPATDEWQVSTPRQLSTRSFGAASEGDRVYLSGGHDTLGAIGGSMEEFDLSSNLDTIPAGDSHSFLLTYDVSPESQVDVHFDTSIASIVADASEYEGHFFRLDGDLDGPRIHIQEPTPTATVTPTETDTPTSTSTATETPSASPTDTDTPTATYTNTSTPTPTVTETPSSTNTVTPTFTPSPLPIEDPRADVDGNGYVDDADMFIVQRNWHRGIMPVADGDK